MKYIKFALALLLSAPFINADTTSNVVATVENAAQAAVAKADQVVSTVASEVKPAVIAVENAVKPIVNGATNAVAPVVAKAEGRLQSLYNSLVNSSLLNNKYSQAVSSRVSALASATKNTLWTNRSTASRVAIVALPVAAATFYSVRKYQEYRTKGITRVGFACKYMGCTFTK